MTRYWLLPPALLWTVFGILVLIALVKIKSKRGGRSALYCCAARIQGFICLLAAVLPTVATVIEELIDELPERCTEAWAKERGHSKLDVVRPMRAG